MHWVEIPSQRVLRVEAGEMATQFDRVEGDGRVLYRRISDRRVFRAAAIQPQDGVVRPVMYLEEI